MNQRTKTVRDGHMWVTQVQEEFRDEHLRARTRIKTARGRMLCEAGGLLVVTLGYRTTAFDAHSPLVDERFAALGLNDVLQPFAEGVGLVRVRGVEAGERGGGARAANQPEGDGEGTDVRAHDEVCVGAWRRRGRWLW